MGRSGLSFLMSPRNPKGPDFGTCFAKSMGIGTVAFSTTSGLTNSPAAKTEC